MAGKHSPKDSSAQGKKKPRSMFIRANKYLFTIFSYLFNSFTQYKINIGKLVKILLGIHKDERCRVISIYDYHVTLRTRGDSWFREQHDGHNHTLETIDSDEIDRTVIDEDNFIKLLGKWNELMLKGLVVGLRGRMIEMPKLEVLVYSNYYPDALRFYKYECQLDLKDEINLVICTIERFHKNIYDIYLYPFGSPRSPSGGKIEFISKKEESVIPTDEDQMVLDCEDEFTY